MSLPLVTHWRAFRLTALFGALAVGSGGPAWAGSWDEAGLGIPLLRSFSARDTGSFAPYRCALQGVDGRLYVGHDGLSVFDGDTWQALPLPENVTVRALAEDSQGRLWVGGENLFGYLEWQPDGVAQFISALPRLAAAHQDDFGGVNALFALPEGQVVAVTDNRVHRLRAGDVHTWSLPAPRRLGAWLDVQGRPIIVQPGTATLVLTEAGLEKAAYPEPYATTGVEWSVSFPDGRTLLGAGTQLLGGLPGTVAPLDDAPLAALLREDRVTSAVPLTEGFAALATLRHGIQIVDSSGRLVATLDRATVLPDNRVVHLAPGEGGSVVATTAESVVVFWDRVRASFYDSRHGLAAKRVTALARSTCGLFAANDRAVLRLTRAPAHGPAGFWRTAAADTDPVVALLPVAEGLLAGSSSNACLIRPEPDLPVALRSADIVAQGPWSGRPGGVAWIEGSRFHRGILAGSTLEPVGNPIEIDNDACSIVEDLGGAHWIATARSGVVRVAPAEQIAAGKPAARTYREGLRATGSHVPRIFRVGTRVFVTTENGLAVYAESGDRFVPFAGLAGSRVHSVATTADDSVWLALSQRDRLPLQVGIARLRATKDGLSCALARLPPVPLEEPPASLFVEPETATHPPIFWLGLNGRIVRLEPSGFLPESPTAPTVSALCIFDDDRSTRRLSETAPRVEFENAGVRFNVHIPGGRLSQRAQLETRLAELDPGWVPLGEIPSRVFRGLRDGAYHFQARTVDALGRPSPTTTFSFAVQPPWWRSGPAYGAYALGLVLLSALVFLTRLRLARAHHRELETLVAQRTRQLAAANTAKSEFLAHVNHEIRNPLNGVIGLSAMLANHHQDENTRQLARSLKACAGYLGSVVDNVLDLARIESGRIEITPQRFDPRTLIEDIAEMFRLQVEEAGGRLTWSADPDLPASLVGDVHRIRQVLVNFTVNAARYARGSDVRLSVRQRNQTPTHVTVVFTVADTGPGIAPAEQARIFEKFSRGSAAAGQAAPRGYGVGLALVRDLAELLGGEADVDSQLGHGAKFRLIIPLEVSAPPAPPTPALAVAAPPSPVPALRVLVIDDQAFNRLVLRDHLERLGCRVEESADGRSAHLLLQARAHHMAFVDLDLPGLDGLALISRVRGEPLERAVFLVATTASATRGIQEQVLAAGADAFLPKPIAPVQLATLVEQCARRLALPAPAAPAAPGLFSELALTPAMIRSLHTELDVETQSLASSWRHADHAGARRHAHRIASLGIIAGDQHLLQAARRAEECLETNLAEASGSVDTLQLAARARIHLLGTTVTATGQDAKN